MRARAGYDFIIQGMGGIMSLTGEPDGAPQKIGVAYRRHLHRPLCRPSRSSRRLREREPTARARISTWRCSTRRSRVLANQAMN